ncbi:hypothetical protein I3842_12G039700 [Carya illinoinensis]|uniref:Uncharacterized protein n=1 Tax=Carya illinoinensis TaxID=32201 RepID=A0A922IW31_CARIL|nr:hypothetical protein I3842_12G039700 [Carya illinoinensis]
MPKKIKQYFIFLRSISCKFSDLLWKSAHDHLIFLLVSASMSLCLNPPIISQIPLPRTCLSLFSSLTHSKCPLYLVSLTHSLSLSLSLRLSPPPPKKKKISLCASLRTVYISLSLFNSSRPSPSNIPGDILFTFFQISKQISFKIFS